jgi:hypothetical protein
VILADVTIDAKLMKAPVQYRSVQARPLLAILTTSTIEFMAALSQVDPAAVSLARAACAGSSAGNTPIMACLRQAGPPVSAQEARGSSQEGHRYENQEENDVGLL